MRGVDADDRQVNSPTFVEIIHFILRFEVNCSDLVNSIEQLRDDLMTMLIAGHETTAAVLTWSIYLLAQVSYFLFGSSNAIAFGDNPNHMIHSCDSASIENEESTGRGRFSAWTGADHI